MKKIIYIIIIIIIFAFAAFGSQGETLDGYFNRVADAIYRIEGGSQTKYPYGIKSINTHGNKITARRICLNTIRNNYARWQDSNKTNDFLTFLGNVYCPAVCDPVGHKNWINNIHKIVK